MNHVSDVSGLKGILIDLSGFLLELFTVRL